MEKEKDYRIHLDVKVCFAEKPSLATVQYITKEIFDFDNSKILGISYYPEYEELEFSTMFDVNWDFWLDKLPKIEEIVSKHLTSQKGGEMSRRKISKEVKQRMKQIEENCQAHGHHLDPWKLDLATKRYYSRCREERCGVICWVWPRKDAVGEIYSGQKRLGKCPC